jgi:hypothetical protein
VVVVCEVVVNSTWEVLRNFTLSVGCVRQRRQSGAGMKLVVYCGENAPLYQLCSA